MAQAEVQFQVKMKRSWDGEAVPAAETQGGIVQAGPTATAHTSPSPPGAATTPVPGKSQR